MHLEFRNVLYTKRHQIVRSACVVSVFAGARGWGGGGGRSAESQGLSALLGGIAKLQIRLNRYEHMLNLNA